MSKYRYVKTSFWDEEYVKDLESEEILVLLYLKTCKEGNQIGIYSFEPYICSKKTGIKLDRIIDILVDSLMMVK